MKVRIFLNKEAYLVSMRKFLAVLLASPLLMILVLIIWINCNLYYTPKVLAVGRDSVSEDLLYQLRGLKAQIENGADEEMQEIYPEGYVFLNAVYGLAWYKLISALPNGSEYSNEALKEIETCWTKINSNYARAQFEEDLPLPYGAYYTGWSNYFLGKKLEIQSANQRNPSEVIRFKKNCDQITSALNTDMYPVSYYGQAWPADVMMCVASLKQHDKLFGSKYDEVIKKWIEQVTSKLDTNGLIPHAADPGNGNVIEAARGSSQSLILIMLNEIDTALARDHFQKYKALFVDTTLGLTGVREYPKGTDGIGDVDSGPVILGYGGAATIVGIQTLSVFGDYESANQIRDAVEGLSFPITSDRKKNYFLGLMPIADAFIAWGDGETQLSATSKHSFLEFHVYSAIAFLLVSVFFWIVVRPKTPDSKETLNIPW